MMIPMVYKQTQRNENNIDKIMERHKNQSGKIMYTNNPKWSHKEL